MGKFTDQRIYRTFEEFEREELRRADSIGSVVDDIFEEMFVDELTLKAPASRPARRALETGDEEE